MHRKHICLMIKNKPEGERSRTLRRRCALDSPSTLVYLEHSRKAQGRLLNHQLSKDVQPSQEYIAILLT